MSNEPEFFNLDPNRLDTEWLGQSRLYYQNATKLADARAEYEQLKSERELVAAEVDQETRKNHKDVGAKLTEATIANLILTDKRYKRANSSLLEAKHSVDVLQAVVDALDHRKKALENLVSLQLANYYSNPRAPEGARDNFRDTERKAVFGTGKERTKR